MKSKDKIKDIFLRTVKVVYVFLLFFGLVVTYCVYNWNPPRVYNTYNYTVVCNNGYTFDPLSKPIYHYFTDDYETGQILHYRVDEINSECEYHTIYNTGKVNNQDDNYVMNKTVKNSEVIRSKYDQIKSTVIAFFAYYLILEIVKRTMLYIFLDKSFLRSKYLLL